MSEETVYALGVAVGPGILIFWIIALLVIMRYPLTRAEHADIIRQLNSRRAGGAGSAPAESA